MNIALILAGGTGQRMGQDVPKQFLCIDNKPVIIYTLEKFQNCPLIDRICVACSEGWESFVSAYAGQFNINKLDLVVCGGSNRFMSVYNLLRGIKDSVREDEDIVLIYDAVRPMITNDIIEDSIRMVREYGAALGVIPCCDSMYTSATEQVITGCNDRDILYRGIGPESTIFTKAWNMYNRYIKHNQLINLTDMLIENGISVAKSKSSQRCIKLTTVEDIELFRAMLKYEKYDWLK